MNKEWMLSVRWALGSFHVVLGVNVFPIFSLHSCIFLYCLYTGWYNIDPIQSHASWLSDKGITHCHDVIFWIMICQDMQAWYYIFCRNKDKESRPWEHTLYFHMFLKITKLISSQPVKWKSILYIRHAF